MVIMSHCKFSHYRNIFTYIAEFIAPRHAKHGTWGETGNVVVYKTDLDTGGVC